MFEIASWVGDQHNVWTVLAAVLICVSGSLLTMRLFSRVRRTQGLQSWNWLFLSGFVGGLTIWTTHFVSMLAYMLPGMVGYDPVLTIMSLSIALITTTGGFAVASRNAQSSLVEAGGVIVGIGIAVMHFTGIAAFKASVHVEWDWRYAVAAVFFGAAFGALATSRIARPVSRYCKYGGAAAFMLAVLLTHFTGMAGMTMTMDPTMVPLPELIRPSMMVALVCLVMLVVLALGTSTYIIDRQAGQAAMDRYRQLSLHDPLTNLPNRAAFNDHVSALMRRPNDTTARIAVLCFDLDRFNGINDLYGHAAGDAVLRIVAQRLTMIMSKGQFVARIGGDEFVAFMDGFYVRGNARALAERVIEEVGKPIEWNGQKLAVGCSVGISTDPAKVSDIDDLLAQANVAMGRAKSEAGSICFYDQSMDEAARKRSALAAEMGEGIRNGQFELAYQQQNDTVSRAVVGFEVLLRWRHPTRGMVSPAEFIPIAEKTGFIRELGEWVLRTACAEAATWAQPIRIAVNVAPLQLADPQLPQRVHTILLETGFPASRLEIEITESSLIADQQVALHAIRRLKALGVKIAMDDYGTGYSSLSTLQSFPFDKIKIDRAFVTDLATSRQSAAIVRSTLILAASLDIPVLAEGVECEEQMEFLRREGCAQVQGFLFGKPVPRSGIEAIVNGGKAAENRGPEADIAILPQIADKAVAA
jgi:diguanylate cyclase (GGDEF)-like protein